MDSNLSQPPGHPINRLSRLSLRWVDDRFQPLGFAVAQMPVLYALKEGNAMTQKELAALARIEQPTMAQLLSRMERDKLICRTPNPEDKRSSLISLTPRALKQLPAAREVLRKGSEAALKGFSEKEICTLNSLLLRAIKNLESETSGL
jgi:MarR family transcriptional regulator for hemolysin